MVWNIFLCFHILGIIIPTDELIFFRRVETTNQNRINHSRRIHRHSLSVRLLHLQSGTCMATAYETCTGKEARDSGARASAVGPFGIHYPKEYELYIYTIIYICVCISCEMAIEREIYIYICVCVLYNIYSNRKIVFLLASNFDFTNLTSKKNIFKKQRLGCTWAVDVIYCF